MFKPDRPLANPRGVDSFGDGMIRTATLALIASAGLFGLSVAAAQTTAPPPPAQAPFAVPPYKNLKVFPQDITRAQLLSSMKFFSQSLGVRCTHCHVGEEGKPLSTFDFASDAKDKKLIARKMLAMVSVLNQTTLPAATGHPDAKVTCFTCHRGSTKPLTAPPPDAVVPAPPAKPESGNG
jgi:hypothetical protein